MRQIAILGIIPLIALSSICFALTGQELLRDCERAGQLGGSLETGRCVSYIDGVIDAKASAALDYYSRTGKTAPPFCLPTSQLTFDQIRLIYSKFARDNPQDLHLPADRLLIRSLANAFPCNPRSQ